MCKEKSLGEVVRGIPALVNLLDYIEGRAASIFVRERIDGQIGNHALADLPAPLAIHYAFEFIRHCSIPIRTGGNPGLTLAVLEDDDVPE